MNNNDNGKGEEASSPNPSSHPVDEFLDQEIWKGYEEMRRKIRKPLTPMAVKIAKNRLLELKNSGENISKVMEQSILGSWQSFHPLKRDQGDNHKNFEERDYRSNTGGFNVDE